MIVLKTYFYGKGVDLDLICFLINGYSWFCGLWVAHFSQCGFWYFKIGHDVMCVEFTTYEQQASGLAAPYDGLVAHAARVHPLIFWYRLTGWGEVRQCAIGSLVPWLILPWYMCVLLVLSECAGQQVSNFVHPSNTACQYAALPIYTHSKT